MYANVTNFKFLNLSLIVEIRNQYSSSFCRKRLEVTMTSAMDIGKQYWVTRNNISPFVLFSGQFWSDAFCRALFQVNSQTGEIVDLGLNKIEIIGVAGCQSNASEVLLGIVCALCVGLERSTALYCFTRTSDSQCCCWGFHCFSVVFPSHKNLEWFSSSGPQKVKKVVRKRRKGYLESLLVARVPVV